MRNKDSCKDIETYSRVVGYFRPVSSWNTGKQEEFKDRKSYSIGIADKYTQRMRNNGEDNGSRRRI